MFGLLKTLSVAVFTVVEYPPGDADPIAAVAALFASIACFLKIPWQV